jgi:hypothetical protein
MTEQFFSSIKNITSKEAAPSNFIFNKNKKKKGKNGVYYYNNY